MKRHFLLFVLISIFLSCNEKEPKTTTLKKEEIVLPPPPRETDFDNLIGFACYSSGLTTGPVTKITKLLENKDYIEIKKRLSTHSAAEKYLATVACERLVKKSLITLSPKDLKQIENNKSSNQKLTICSGCTNEEELTLKKMFSSKTFLEYSVEKWLKESIQ